MFLWIKSYLHNHRARVVIDNTKSKNILLRHGVPQGRVMLPTLFFVFINDLINKFPSPVKCAMYADDLVLWSTEQYATTAKIQLQEATNILSSSAKDWCVKINKTKLFLTLFTLSTKLKPMKIMLDDTELQHTDSTIYLGITLDKRQTWKTHISRAEAKAKSAIYTLDKVQNQALRLITGSLKSTPIRVMEETTAIQPLSKRRDMRNIIQAERYKCSLSHPMRKIMDAMTKHRIKKESFIHKNNNLKRTYNNNNIKTVQYTCSSPPMSTEDTNRSLTIRTTIPTVTRDQGNTSKKLLTHSHIDYFYPQDTWIHVYTDGSATDAVQDGGAGSLIYLPNGQPLEADSDRKIQHKLRCRSESHKTRSSSRDRPNRYQLKRRSISYRFPVSIRLTSWAWRTQPQTVQHMRTQMSDPTVDSNTLWCQRQ